MKCKTCGVDASDSYVFRDRRVPFVAGLGVYYCIKCVPQEVLDVTPPEILRTAQSINEMEKWNVRLTRDEVDQAYLEAAASGINNKENNRTENWEMLNSQKEMLDQNADARGAELAFAKVMGLKANPYVETFDGPDVGEIYQIKQTLLSNGHLRIPFKKRHTQKNHCFVLVIGECPKFKIKGWIHAQEGMKPKFFKEWARSENEKCWWVPQFMLHPMDTLPLPPDYTSVDLPEGLVFIPVKEQVQTTKETYESSANTDR